jgi:alkanesulfonate monooxygenase SsuD/methylene tetrahydromethanopterin reductase-like flavin-dependent oxidoreductase (luciferase family)
MRFTYAESMCAPDQLVPLALAAEEAGYTSMTVPDSICYPRESDTKYPYTGDGNREFLEGKPFIEPFVLVATLGAVTERLRFTTFVVKLAIRQPVLVAKQASSLAVMTGNRFGFGVGLSPWPEDFAVTGTEWKRRGKRMDEMIEIVRGLTAGGFFEFHGEFYDIPPIAMSPAPTRPIPILVGDHSDAALRRAARLGNGWMHGGGPNDDLGGRAQRRPRRAARHVARASRRVRPGEAALRDPRDLTRRLHGRRRATPRGQGRHGHRRRLSQRLRDRHHDAAAEAGRPARLRRQRDREGFLSG